MQSHLINCSLAAEIPSKDQAASDIQELVLALRQLIISLLTSSTLRIILYEFFDTAREMAADIAADVGRVAAVVEASAEKVEDVLRPEGATLEDIQIHARDVANDLVTGDHATSEETKTRWHHLGSDSPESVKKAVVTRMQQVLYLYFLHIESNHSDQDLADHGRGAFQQSIRRGFANHHVSSQGLHE